MNHTLEERRFAKSVQIGHRCLYDELFYIKNSNSLITESTPEEARSAMDTLYTTIENALRLVCPFMPFLTEELWQRLPRRPGDGTLSIAIAGYPEYKSSLHNPRSEVAYDLVLGCSKGTRSLMADYGVKDVGGPYIAPLNQISHDVALAQLSAIESLSGKTPAKISVVKTRETNLIACALFPVSADANVYLEVKNRIQNATTEAEKFKAKVDEVKREQFNINAIKVELSKVQGKDVTHAMQSVESRKQDIEARLLAF